MPRQVVQIDFSGGVDQRTEAAHVIAGKLTSLVNGQYEKDGSIKKRRGFTALSRSQTAADWAGVSTLAAAKHLTSFQDELVLLNGETLFSYSPTAGKWATKDTGPQFGLDPLKQLVAGETSTATRNVVSYVAPAIGYANGFYVVVWSDGYWSTTYGGSNLGAIGYSVHDATTMTQVASGFVETGIAYAAPRLTVSGNNAYIVYHDGLGTLYGREFSTSTLTWGSRISLATDVRVSAAASYAVTSASDLVHVVYENNAGASPRLSYTVRTAGASLTSSGSGTLSDNSFAGPFFLTTVATAGGTWWIGFATISGGVIEIWAQGRNVTTYVSTISAFRANNATTAGSILNVGCCKLTGSNTIALVVSALDGTATTGGYGAYWVQAASGGTASLMRRTPHAIWGSQPFILGGKTLAWQYYYPHTVNTADDQETAVLVDLFTEDTATSGLCARPVAVAAPRIAQSSIVQSTTSNHLPLVVSTPTATKMAALIGTQPGLELRALDMAIVSSAPTFTSCELGASLFLSGGILTHYDGARVAEVAPITYPEKITTVTKSNGSGGLTATGTYQHCLVLERTTAKGEVVRSAVSDVVTTTLAGAEDTIAFYVTMPPWTTFGEAGNSFAPNAVIELYRTTSGGSVFYRVPRTKTYDVALARYGPITQAPNTWVYQYEDHAADSDLSGQPILYTTGGVLDNVCPPGSNIVCVHRDRLFVADGKTVWFSTQRDANTAGIVPRWNERDRFVVEDGGDITAMATLGANLAIFKRDKIYVVAGDGPDITGGTGQEFSPPQRISSDVGCIESRSVAVTPAGTVFQSAAGIYLLTTGGQVQYLSGPVEDTLAANPTITSATVHESLFQVRFSCNSSGSTGVVLVWDYAPSQAAPLGRWSTFQLYDTTAALASAAIAGSCNSRGSYYWAATNGTVYQESSSSYLDGSQWVTLSFETAWIKFAGLQGFQRIWAVGLLGERQSDHNLLFQYAVDYSATYSTAINKNVQSSFGLEQLRYVPRTQKCQSMRVKFADATPTSGTVGTGRALTFTGLAFEAKALPKINRLASTKRA